MIDKCGKDIELEIDGGVTPKNVAVPLSLGVNVVVAGSSVFKAEDAKAAIAEMRAIVE